jgi:hypothetical protein
VKIGEPTGELTQCDGGDWIDGPGCKNLVRVLHDPYCTADLALCSECNGGGEIYGPIIVPSWEDDEEEVEHAFTPECCADCRRLIEDEDRLFAEADAEEETTFCHDCGAECSGSLCDSIESSPLPAAPPSA